MEGMGNYHKSLQLLKAYLMTLKDSISGEEVSNRVNRFCRRIRLRPFWKWEDLNWLYRLKKKQTRFLLGTTFNRPCWCSPLSFCRLSAEDEPTSEEDDDSDEGWLHSNVSHEIRPLNYITWVFWRLLAQTANDEKGYPDGEDTSGEWAVAQDVRRYDYLVG